MRLKNTAPVQKNLSSTVKTRLLTKHPLVHGREAGTANTRRLTRVNTSLFTRKYKENLEFCGLAKPDRAGLGGQTVKIPLQCRPHRRHVAGNLFAQFRRRAETLLFPQLHADFQLQFGTIQVAAEIQKMRLDA